MAEARAAPVPSHPQRTALRWPREAWSPIGSGYSRRGSSFDAPDAEHGSNREEQILEFEPQRPILDVVVVPFRPVGDRRPPAEPVHLRPARDARFHPVAVAVATDAGLELLADTRSLRARTNEDKH